MANALSLRMAPEKIAAMQSVIEECSLQHIDAAGQMQAMFKMAAGVRELRKLITPEAMTDIMELQNTSLGFRTDKQQGGYPVDVVKDVVIEASLRGVRTVGNELNIISGRLYVTREGFARLVREFPGLTDLRLTPSVPRMKDGGALVSYRATWNLDGKPQSLEREFPVRVNSGMGADAIIGKATRKMLAAIYGQLTGSEHALPEGEVGDMEAPRTAVSTLNDNLPPEAADRPSLPEEIDSEVMEQLRIDLASALTAGDVSKTEESCRSRHVNDATRTAISGECEAVRQRIKASPSAKKMGSLSGT